MAYNVGRVDTAYVSSIALLNDREIMNKIANRYGEKDFMDIMMLLGKMKVTGQEEYNHFEDDWLFHSVEVAAKAGTVGGVDVDAVLTLAASAHSNGGKDSHPRVGDEVLLKTRKKGLIIAKGTGTAGAHTITVRPQTGQDVWTDIVAGDLLAITNTVAAEGTGSPEGRKSNFVSFKNNTMRFKESFAITVDQAVAKMSVEYNGKPYFMAKGQHDALLKFQISEALALLTSTGGGYNADGIKTTRGLDAEVRANGQVSALATAGTFAKTDLRVLSKKLDRVNAPDEFHFYMGAELTRMWEDLLHSLDGVKAGGINYSSFGTGNAKERAIDLGFDSVRAYGRTIHAKKLKALSHPQATWANDSFKWASNGFLIPTESVKEAKTGNKLDRICIRYQEGDGFNLGYHEAWTGKFAPTGATNDISEARVHYESKKGLQVVGAKDMIVIEG